uniref:Uncharacterized protein n=1 Tax=Pithovirus LCPAC304 TaxID=2506594 RepID=A0A481Z9G5_9VIRU|nr:MAG: hypothetical protein LCPAC304_00750 [Pithovirus LCPAC304]
MGWKQYMGLEYVDYTDQIFQSLIKTRYAKRQFSMMMSVLITWIVRWHLKTLFSFFFEFHPLIDFILQILLSVCLVFKNSWIRNVVNRFQNEIYALSRYLINNYTRENYRVWKRNITVGVCIYFLVYLMMVEISSALLIGQIGQFLISYFIVDGIEQRTFVKAWIYCKEWYQRHLCRQGTQLTNKTLTIRDTYLDTDSSSSSSSDSKSNAEESEVLWKSWMGLDNVIVVEDSPTHSIVVFQD